MNLTQTQRDAALRQSKLDPEQTQKLVEHLDTCRADRFNALVAELSQDQGATGELVRSITGRPVPQPGDSPANKTVTVPNRL